MRKTDWQDSTASKFTSAKRPENNQGKPPKVQSARVGRRLTGRGRAVIFRAVTNLIDAMENR